jgi:hypothetical protein
MHPLRPVAAFALVALLAASPAPTAQTGGVYVATLPDAADVWLDGSYVGRSPVLLDGLLPGRHALTVSRFGWESQDTVLEVAAGRLGGTLLQLNRAGSSKPGKGRLQLHGATPSAVTMDGAPLKLDAQGGAIVPSGPHAMVVHTAKGRFDRAVRVFPEMTTDLVLAEPRTTEARSSVVAPAEDYLPPSAYKVTGTRVVVKYKTHVVVARVGDTSFVMDGKSVSFDAAPVLLQDKLYLPLALLEALAGTKD